MDKIKTLASPHFKKIFTFFGILSLFVGIVFLFNSSAGFEDLSSKAISQPTYSGAWKAGAWKACSNPCTEKTQTRTVSCIKNGRTVSNSLCDPKKKPVTTQPCTNKCTSFLCTGNVPNNAIMCSGDDTPLSANTTRSLVSICTASKKCEYTCVTNSTLLGGKCVQNTTTTTYLCTGSTPENATLCSGDELQLSANTIKSITSACTTTKKCEYTCAVNFTFQGGKCVPKCRIKTDDDLDIMFYAPGLETRLDSATKITFTTDKTSVTGSYEIGGEKFTCDSGVLAQPYYPENMYVSEADKKPHILIECENGHSLLETITANGVILEITKC